MATKKPTEKEVRFARALLKALHANEQNGYLLLAILAWLRGADNVTSWKGNNPLNLKLHGRPLTFRSYLAAAGATAKFLLNSKKADLRLLVRIARRPAADSPGQVAQARDFLYQLGLTNWDKTHYGLAAYVDPPGHWVSESEDQKPVWVDPPGSWVVGTDQTKNQLLAVWAALTGAHIPKSWFVDSVTTTRAPKAPFQQQAPGFHQVPLHPYIQPYAAASFYSARQHLGDLVLVD